MFANNNISKGAQSYQIYTIRMLFLKIASGTASIIKDLLNKCLSKVPLGLIWRSFEYLTVWAQGFVCSRSFASILSVTRGLRILGFQLGLLIINFHSF